MKTIYAITPCFNAGKNLLELYNSLKDQINSFWEWHVVDDMSTDDTEIVIKELINSDARIHYIKNEEKKYALRNVVETCKKIENRFGIAAIIDGDDVLCNEKAFSLINEEYEKSCDVVWTKHRWNPGGQNISEPIPYNYNPYQYKWVSSHLKTFSIDLLHNIRDENFKDINGKWFERGYDQALYLPIIHVASKRSFVPEICYQYNLKSVSITNSQRAMDSTGAQVKTVNFVRARGFVK